LKEYFGAAPVLRAIAKYTSANEKQVAGFLAGKRQVEAERAQEFAEEYVANAKAANPQEPAHVA
jgi:hypothetical protein